MTRRTQVLIGGLVLLALAAYLNGQAHNPSDGRFQLGTVAGIVVRLDTRSGAMAACEPRSRPLRVVCGDSAAIQDSLEADGIRRIGANSGLPQRETRP